MRLFISISMWIQALGALGMFFSECSYAIQVQHLHRTKSIDGIHLGFSFLNILGRLLTSIYSFYISNYILGIFFTIGFMIRVIFLIQVTMYMKKKQA